MPTVFNMSSHLLKCKCIVDLTAMQDEVYISLPFQRVILGFLVIVIIEAFTVNIH